MNLDKFLMAMVIIGILSLGVGNLFSSLATSYGVTVEERYQAAFNKFNQTTALAEDIVADVKPASVGEETNDWDVGKTVQAALNVVKVVFIQGLPTMFSLITNMADFIPLPGYVIAGFQALIMISLCFALVYLYFRYKNG